MSTIFKKKDYLEGKDNDGEKKVSLDEKGEESNEKKGESSKRNGNSGTQKTD